MVTASVGLAVVLCTLSPFFAAADPLQSKASECQTILRKAGASENFGERAGHGVHSIYVQELQKFNKNATVINRIPTVNLDLTSKLQVLPNAPMHKFDARFNDDALETIDWVLTNMDNPMYYIAEAGPLERMVHMFQMKKVWRVAKKTYNMIVQNPPSPQVCKCASDIDNNGIMDELIRICRDTHEKMMSGSDPTFTTPFITNQAAWEAFKKVQFDLEFKNQNDNQYDVALFIYCQLNTPQN